MMENLITIIGVALPFSRAALTAPGEYLILIVVAALAAGLVRAYKEIVKEVKSGGR